MDPEDEKKWAVWERALERIRADVVEYHPKTVLVFGSTARYMNGKPVDHFPRDIDLLIVTGNPPYKIGHTDYGAPVELHHYRVDQVVTIAKILRYDPRPVALPKLYGRLFLKRHCIDVITAALLLGPDYGHFGIEQIDIDGLPDSRDYSVHTVLCGERWWARLRRYARDRRGLVQRWSDKIVGRYEFEG